jgi:hypothetical protein
MPNAAYKTARTNTGVLKLMMCSQKRTAASAEQGEETRE